MIRNILDEQGEPVTLQINSITLYPSGMIGVDAEGRGCIVLRYEPAVCSWLIQPALAPNGEPWGDE